MRVLWRYPQRRMGLLDLVDQSNRMDLAKTSLPRGGKRPGLGSLYAGFAPL